MTSNRPFQGALDKLVRYTLRDRAVAWDAPRGSDGGPAGHGKEQRRISERESGQMGATAAKFAVPVELSYEKRCFEPVSPLGLAVAVERNIDGHRGSLAQFRMHGKRTAGEAGALLHGNHAQPRLRGFCLLIEADAEVHDFEL